jgi:hypothetical protein
VEAGPVASSAGPTTLHLAHCFWHFPRTGQSVPTALLRHGGIWRDPGDTPPTCRDPLASAEIRPKRPKL